MHDLYCKVAAKLGLNSAGIASGASGSGVAASLGLNAAGIASGASGSGGEALYEALAVVALRSTCSSGTCSRGKSESSRGKSECSRGKSKCFGCDQTITDIIPTSIFKGCQVAKSLNCNCFQT
jgi:hypothetical protein